MPWTQSHKIKIHYRLEGSGPKLTIIGGLGDSFRNWAALMPMLHRHYSVLVIENRGAGQSDRPPGPYVMNDFSADVEAVLQELSFFPTALLGFSMGGKIAMDLCLRSSHLIEKLILVSTSASGQEFPDNVKNILQSFDGSDNHFREQFKLLFSSNYQKRFGADSFVRFKNEDLHPQKPEEFLSQLKAVESFDVRSKINSLKIPTLILHGSDDNLTPVENAHDLVQKIQNAHLKIYPDVGHIPQAEKTKEFLEDVRKFIFTGTLAS